MISSYTRKVVNLRIVTLSLLTLVFLLGSACKKDLGKMNYPSSLILGETSQNNFFFQDSLGSASSVFGAGTSVSNQYNLDNLGPNDIQISVNNYSQTGFGQYSYVNLYTLSDNISVLTDVSGDPVVLNASDTITTYSGIWQSGNFELSYTDNSLNSSGAWSDQQEKYIGVRISGLILGWMKISVTHPSFDAYQLVLVHEIGAFN